MIRPIMKDVFFLSQKSEPATLNDISVGRDLQDTLKAHRNECVGMAANMIGIKKNVIIVNMEFFDIVMFNPVIIAKKHPFDTEEGCLSLTGVRPCRRYREVEIEYQDFSFKKQKIVLKDWPAQIAQHEIDHLQGIII